MLLYDFECVFIEFIEGGYGWDTDGVMVDKVRVLTDRTESYMKPLFAHFTQTTGIDDFLGYRRYEAAALVCQRALQREPRHWQLHYRAGVANAQWSTLST